MNDNRFPLIARGARIERQLTFLHTRWVHAIISSLSTLLHFQFSHYIGFCPFSNQRQSLLSESAKLHLLVMAFAHCLPAVSVGTSSKFPKASILTPSCSISPKCLFSVKFSSAPCFRVHKHSFVARFRKIGHQAKAKPHEPEVSVANDAFTQFKHLLLPITDRNPHLSEGTKQAISTTTALAKMYGADITVVVIDEQQKESLPEHETQLSSIRWHLSEGGFKDYGLLERLGEGSKPTAIIGDVADDLNLDLVVLSMEAIHTKHIDANLLAEFIPCPVMLLPL